MKKFKVFLILLTAAFVLAACGGDTTSEEPADAPKEAVEVNTDEDSTEETDAGAAESEEEGQVFTLEELGEYNGQDGNPAYVAVDGVVYDVTDIGAWEEGEHFGLEAGTDSTDQIEESPHGDVVLENLPVVGTLE